jgi:murein L,D-transpeptidase YafK
MKPATTWVLALWVGLVAWQGVAYAEHAEHPSHDEWIFVDTETHTLSVFRNGNLVERFRNISIGRGGASIDRVRGDGTTPLGTFRINRIHPSSRYVLFFGIDFPRPEHARRAFDAGRIDADDYERILAAFARGEPPPQNTPLGGQLGIHGLGEGSRQVHAALNWTQGCVALTNAQIRRLSRLIHVGMRVEVR